MAESDRMNIKDLWLKEGAKAEKVRRGTILAHAGRPFNRAFYVISGILRSYTIDENGKEHVFMFAPEGWIVSDIAAHVFKEDSHLFIDALEETEVLSLEISKIETLNLRNIEVNEQHKALLRRCGVLQKRIIMLMSMNASQRYLQFLETYPNISNRISQKHIASYLGTTAETLSYVKGKMKREKQNEARKAKS